MDLLEREKILREKQQEQEILKKKYNIDENVIIKEKNNIGKFIVKTVFNIIKVIATIIIILLATIGLISLCYSNVRSELFIILNEILEQLPLIKGWIA